MREARPCGCRLSLRTLIGYAGKQRRDGGIGGDDRPMPVDREGREGLVPLQDEVDSLSRRGKRRVVQLALGKDRRKSGREKHRIAFAQRHAEPFGEMHQHLAAWKRAPALDEAQMSLRYIGLKGEFELAQASSLTPFAQMVAERAGRVHHAAAGSWSMKP